MNWVFAVPDVSRAFTHRLASVMVAPTTNPDEFYPPDANGVVRKFNDLPAAMHRNVNSREVPYDRDPGNAPRLTDAEVIDVVAFPDTFTDEYNRNTHTADPARNVPASP